jgi:hypothetical protein
MIFFLPHAAPSFFLYLIFSQIILDKNERTLFLPESGEYIGESERREIKPPQNKCVL